LINESCAITVSFHQLHEVIIKAIWHLTLSDELKVLCVEIEWRLGKLDVFQSY